MNLVSRPHAKALLAYLRSHPKDLVLSADLTSSCEANDIRDQLPSQFISVGMTEQHMIGLAAGLAREGYRPWLHTFAVFLTRRVFDQVAMSVGYPRLPVRIVGFLPGITTPGGVTHQAIDDVGLMRLIPGMTIIDCGDATEVESTMNAVGDLPGPVYIRMLRGEVPRLFPAEETLTLEGCRILSQGNGPLVISSSICTEEALRALAILKTRGVQATHLHISTMAPFPVQTVMPFLRQAKSGVITLENHLYTGGLGTCIAEMMAEQGLGQRLIRLGLKGYAHGASKAYLMRECGIDAQALVEAMEQISGKKLNIQASDLAAVRLEAVHSSHKPEGL